MLSDHGYVMLLVEDFFRTFTTKELCDATARAEVILAISAESGEHVDGLVRNVVDAGGRPADEAMDHGFMYAWSFHDLDGQGPTNTRQHGGIPGRHGSPRDGPAR